MALFHSFWTALLMILFVLIIVRAWSRKRVAQYEAAARIPLEEESAADGSGKDG